MFLNEHEKTSIQRFINWFQISRKNNAMGTLKINKSISLVKHAISFGVKGNITLHETTMR